MFFRGPVFGAKVDWVLNQREMNARKKTITKRGYQKIASEIESQNLKDIFEQEEKDLQEKYKEWKMKVDEIVDRNRTLVKKRNKNKTVRNLLRARRRIKKEECYEEERKRLKIERIKLINGYIKEEENEQYRR